jgi:hypothetical protein
MRIAAAYVPRLVFIQVASKGEGPTGLRVFSTCHAAAAETDCVNIASHFPLLNVCFMNLAGGANSAIQ